MQMPHRRNASRMPHLSSIFNLCSFLITFPEASTWPPRMRHPGQPCTASSPGPVPTDDTLVDASSNDPVSQGKGGGGRNNRPGLAWVHTPRSIPFICPPVVVPEGPNRNLLLFHLSFSLIFICKTMLKCLFADMCMQPFNAIWRLYSFRRFSSICKDFLNDFPNDFLKVLRIHRLIATIRCAVAHRMAQHDVLRKCCWNFGGSYLWMNK